MVWHGVYGCALYGMLWYGMALYGMAWYCVAVEGMQEQPQWAQSALHIHPSMLFPMHGMQGLHCIVLQGQTLPLEMQWGAVTAVSKAVKKERIQIGTFATLKIGLQDLLPNFYPLENSTSLSSSLSPFTITNAIDIVDSLLRLSCYSSRWLCSTTQYACSTRHRVTLQWILPKSTLCTINSTSVHPLYQ